MRTKVTTSVEAAAMEIKKGNVVAFPTETVYGLGADAFNEKAVAKIFSAKHRPADNPLIVHVWNLSQFSQLTDELNPRTAKLARKFFPGPLSLVVKKRKAVPNVVTAGLKKVCVRMPSLQITRKFLKACGTPVAAPSANLSGRPSPTSWRHVLHDLNGKIPLILKGPPCHFGLESTVLDCTVNPPVLLRPGAVSVEQLERQIGKIRIPKKIRKALSPGLKYRHYAPKAKVVLVNSVAEVPPGKNSAFIGFDNSTTSFVANPRTAAEYARFLYDFFRECDLRGIRTIYAQKPSKAGIGRALLDRLTRAAKHN